MLMTPNGRAPQRSSRVHALPPRACAGRKRGFEDASVSNALLGVSEACGGVVKRVARLVPDGCIAQNGVEGRSSRVRALQVVDAADAEREEVRDTGIEDDIELDDWEVPGEHASEAPEGEDACPPVNDDCAPVTPQPVRIRGRGHERRLQIAALNHGLKSTSQFWQALGSFGKFWERLKVRLYTKIPVPSTDGARERVPLGRVDEDAQNGVTFETPKKLSWKEMEQKRLEAWNARAASIWENITTKKHKTVENAVENEDDVNDAVNGDQEVDGSDDDWSPEDEDEDDDEHEDCVIKSVRTKPVRWRGGCEPGVRRGNVALLAMPPTGGVIVQFAREVSARGLYGHPWTSRACAEAASHGLLDCLTYAHENGCPWDSRTCAEAAKNGHLD